MVLQSTLSFEVEDCILVGREFFFASIENLGSPGVIDMVCLGLHDLHLSSYSFPNVLGSNQWICCPARCSNDHQTGTQMPNPGPFAGIYRSGLSSIDFRSTLGRSILVHATTRLHVQCLMPVVVDWTAVVGFVAQRSPFPVVVVR